VNASRLAQAVIAELICLALKLLISKKKSNLTRFASVDVGRKVA
jgi:hypothetical protein